jgi:pyridoxal phosphate enzyme (YggS family)
MGIANNIQELKSTIPLGVRLVAVSKTKPIASIAEAYQGGQRAFGENKVQELCDKYELLPKDIEWHMIGHLQTNKVKYIAPFVHLIHSVDRMKLLKEINLRAEQQDRQIDCLLQVHIAEEESKFGFNEIELTNLIENQVFSTIPHVRIRGLMGMATFTNNSEILRKEFKQLHQFFEKLHTTHFSKNSHFDTLSMGMSGDYSIAIDCGSNMIRVGSAIFGHRN